MRFTKMHGTGNDYIYVDGFHETVARPQEVARRISDRHFGVGSDGLILIQPPSGRDADCRMEMYNADGSRGCMCGNGIRCVAKYLHDRGRSAGPAIRVETDTGTKTVRVVSASGGKADLLEVDMGAPALARAAIPLRDGGDPREPAIDVPCEAGDHVFRITAVSMGNPHAVIRLDGPGEKGARPLPALADAPLADWGPQLERHPWFPERVNAEFITLRSRREIDFRVWERGSGETLACGTGACAALVAAVVNGWCDPEAIVHLRGGDLRIRWDRAPEDPRERRLGGGLILMTGSAVEVFSGDWPA
jgi:diaminopimelate epimerase